VLTDCKKDTLISSNQTDGLVVVAHRTSLRCHRTSRPLNISCGSANEGYVLAGNTAGKEEIVQPVTQSTDGIGKGKGHPATGRRGPRGSG